VPSSSSGGGSGARNGVERQPLRELLRVDGDRSHLSNEEQTVDKKRLRKYVGRLDHDDLSRVCRALAIATGCAS
jgi:hypothetical protein